MFGIPAKALNAIVKIITLAITKSILHECLHQKVKE
jgi:hypothetical protein